MNLPQISVPPAPAGVDEPQLSRHLLRGAYSLIANTAISSALGMGFWVAAARLYPSATVGRDTVLISTMIELSTLCQLNLGNAIVRFLPELGKRTAWVLASAYGIATGLAIVVGAGFVLLAPSISGELAYLGHDPALAFAYVTALALWGLFTLQDAALTAVRQAPWIPLENGVFGLLKLAALPLLLTLGVANGIFFAWALPMALLLIPVSAFIFRRAVPKHVAGRVGGTAIARIRTRQTARFLAQDYLATVFTQATLTVLPILVIAFLGARQAAYFAMPFAIAIAFDTFAYSACTSLVVESTLKPDRLRALTGVFVHRVLTLLAPAAIILALAAPLVMLPFGRAYAQQGSGVLRLLLCASLLRIVIALFSAVSRAQQRGLRLALVEFALLGLVLGGSITLTRSHGIEGTAAAWLAANAIIAAVVAPLLVRFLREPRPAAQEE